MKGSIFDAFFITIIVFVLAIIVIIGHTVLSQTITAVNAAPNVTAGIQVMNVTILQQGQDALEVYDIMMPFIMIMLLIISIALAILNPTHPIFIIFAILTTSMFLLIVPQISNVYDQIIANDQLTASANEFTITATIMDNLPLIFLILAVIITIALFIAFRSRSEVAA